MSSTARPTGDVSRVRPDVQAAGAVVLRKDAVLLVHRPAYGDWSFPKKPRPRRAGACRRRPRGRRGDRCAHPPRYAAELAALPEPRPREDGVLLARPGRGRPPGGRRLVNDEIDEVAWVPVRKARKQLSYTFDQNTLEEALSTEWRTRGWWCCGTRRPARRRRGARTTRLRPLLAEGKRDATRLIPSLAAYAPSRLVTSSSVRCAQTLAPYAAACGWPLLETDALSEEDATAEGVGDIVAELLQNKECAALCTHRPVLPTVFESLGVVTESRPPESSSWCTTARASSRRSSATDGAPRRARPPPRPTSGPLRVGRRP